MKDIALCVCVCVCVFYAAMGKLRFWEVIQHVQSTTAINFNFPTQNFNLDLSNPKPLLSLWIRCAYSWTVHERHFIAWNPSCLAHLLNISMALHTPFCCYIIFCFITHFRVDGHLGQFQLLLSQVMLLWTSLFVSFGAHAHFFCWYTLGSGIAES